MFGTRKSAPAKPGECTRWSKRDYGAACGNRKLDADRNCDGCEKGALHAPCWQAYTTTYLSATETSHCERVGSQLCMSCIQTVLAKVRGVIVPSASLSWHARLVLIRNILAYLVLILNKINDTNNPAHPNSGWTGTDTKYPNLFSINT